MRKNLEILLRFNVKALDGVVTGYGRMASFIEGELPRVGDRIRPCTGDSAIDSLMDVYSLDVASVCRNVGGDFTQPVLCEVNLSTWDPHSGKLTEGGQRTKKKVLSDWEKLKEIYEAPIWNLDRREGMKIVSLILINE